MSDSIKIAFERARVEDAQSLSDLMREVYRGELTDDQSDVRFIEEQISAQTCAFDIIVKVPTGPGTSGNGREIIGLAWSYLHVPRDWPRNRGSGSMGVHGAQRKREKITRSFFGPRAREPTDFGDRGFDVVTGSWIAESRASGTLPAIRELEEPVICKLASADRPVRSGTAG